MADADLRDRMARAMREHYLNTSSPEQTADGGLPCSCGSWWEGSIEDGDEYDWLAHLADAALRVVQAELDRLAAERDSAYRERAQLLAELATHYPAVLAPAPDVDEPGWTLLYVTLPTGQASWHQHPRDRDLFGHVEHVPADDPRAQWDGHTTEEKYERLRQVTAQNAAAEAAWLRGEAEATAADPF